MRWGTGKKAICDGMKKYRLEIPTNNQAQTLKTLEKIAVLGRVEVITTTKNSIEFWTVTQQTKPSSVSIEFWAFPNRLTALFQIIGTGSKFQCLQYDKRHTFPNTPISHGSQRKRRPTRFRRPRPPVRAKLKNIK